MGRAPSPRALVVVAALVAAAVAAPLAGTSSERKPHVTLIGDSVADALVNYDRARAILSKGIELDLEVAPCRRVGQKSCPYNGVSAPNVIELVHTMGDSLGPTVIVAVGYNDFDEAYGLNIENALDALKQAGVKRVLWPTLRATEHSYLHMNDAILAAASRHREMTVIDWNLYSRSHPDWFQTDGVHVTRPGAEAMATLFHQTLADLGVLGPGAGPPHSAGPPVTIVTAKLPAARKGKPYSAKLSAAGGRSPYFWSFPRRPPKGLHLRPTGWIFGTPRGRTGRFVIDVGVRDSVGSAASTRFVLRVGR